LIDNQTGTLYKHGGSTQFPHFGEALYYYLFVANFSELSASVHISLKLIISQHSH